MTLEEIKKLNLFEKIQLVSNDIRNIEKNMQVGNATYGYKAVSDLDVTLKVKDAETKYRIISIPVKQEIINSEVLKIRDGEKEKILYVDNIKLTLKIIDLDDITSFIDVEAYGKGLDSGDKGFGKASTYARKYALLNAYKIATGEDPDANKSEQNSVDRVDEKRIIVYNKLDKDMITKDQVLKHFKVSDLSQLNDADIERIYNNWKNKGEL